MHLWANPEKFRKIQNPVSLQNSGTHFVIHQFENKIDWQIMSDDLPVFSETPTYHPLLFFKLIFKTLMKKALIIIAVILPFLCQAQDETRIKEVGVTFSNLESFGLTYRMGSQNAVWRFNTIFINGSHQNNIADSMDFKRRNVGAGIYFGREYRTEIADKLEFRYGLDLSLIYTHRKNESTSRYANATYSANYTLYEPGVGVILGINYVTPKNLVFGAEILPSVRYMVGKDFHSTTSDSGTNTVDYDVSGLSYGISNTSAVLSVAYRF